MSDTTITRRMMWQGLAAATIALGATTGSALAFGPQGHEVVGAIADQMLRPPAAAKVKALLGSKLPLRSAATWADCAKNVEPVAGQPGQLQYVADPQYHASCGQFETAPGQARLVDYVQRNWAQCSTAPRTQACHKKYHFADVAIQQDRYDRALAGTSDHDIVSAMNAAIAVLQGKKPAGPVSIRDRKEALLLLAHLAGDIHQPLHVGSVYLDHANHPVDPGPAGQPVDHAMDTVGGNAIKDGSSNLHAEWDAVRRSLNPLALPAPLLAAAQAVAPTPGDVKDWPAQWATGTLRSARSAFDGLAFDHTGASKPADWVVKIADRSAYAARRTALQEQQLALAGARLAQLLNTIWP
jgi:hypothetical protein